MIFQNIVIFHNKHHKGLAFIFVLVVLLVPNEAPKDLRQGIGDVDHDALSSSAMVISGLIGDI